MITINDIYAHTRYNYNIPLKPAEKRRTGGNALLCNTSELPYFTDYSRVSFTGLKINKTNIKSESEKLLRQITEILDSDIPESDEEDIAAKVTRAGVSFARRKAKKEKEILEKLDVIYNDRRLNLQMKLNEIQRLRKEYNTILNTKFFKIRVNKRDPKTEKIDYTLLNKFKSSILGNDFDLNKVYQKYYSGLNDISTVEELKKIFPKIVVPDKPEFEISKKIERSFGRDFYENLYEKIDNPDEMYKIADNKIRTVLTSIAGKFKADPQNLYKRLYSSLHNSVIARLKQVSDKSELSKIVTPNKKSYEITPVDINMLNADYDDFVLSTVRRQYLNLEKLNNIVYENGKIKIPVSSLKDTAYKFEKVSEKIKGFLKAGEQIKTAQRDYDNFTPNELRLRLNMFINEEMANDDEILEQLIKFDSCIFHQIQLP